jgi:hypothetical protein
MLVGLFDKRSRKDRRQNFLIALMQGDLLILDSRAAQLYTWTFLQLRNCSQFQEPFCYVECLFLPGDQVATIESDSASLSENPMPAIHVLPPGSGELELQWIDGRDDEWQLETYQQLTARDRKTVATYRMLSSENGNRQKERPDWIVLRAHAMCDVCAFRGEQTKIQHARQAKEVQLKLLEYLDLADAALEHWGCTDATYSFALECTDDALNWQSDIASVFRKRNLTHMSSMMTSVWTDNYRDYDSKQRLMSSGWLVFSERV